MGATPASSTGMTLRWTAIGKRCAHGALVIPRPRQPTAEPSPAAICGEVVLSASVADGFRLTPVIGLRPTYAGCRPKPDLGTTEQSGGMQSFGHCQRYERLS